MINDPREDIDLAIDELLVLDPRSRVNRHNQSKPIRRGSGLLSRVSHMGYRSVTHSQTMYANEK